MKKKNLTYLEKARDHFLKAFTEIGIGAEFAIKGTRNLLSEREKRKIMFGLTESLFRKGFDLATKLTDVLTQLQSKKPAKQRPRRKRVRKVEIR